MPVISDPCELVQEDLYVDLRQDFGHALYLKCEGFNFAGSIKIKSAMEMVLAGERDGLLRPDSILVESSSGNMGVALSLVAASRGYRFVCVTDIRCTRNTRKLMEVLGTQVRVVEKPHPADGLLGARIQCVRELCALDERYVWLNQYVNEANAAAHYRRTAPAIAERFPDLDVLFVGAGTTGTLMGCARYFREKAPHVHVVAVDSVGSVTFGGAMSHRLIPGLGTSLRPALLDESLVDDVLMVTELDTIRTCHRLLRRGFLFGGSTGTVTSGAVAWLDVHEARFRSHGLTAVAIGADLGERYLDSIYDRDWVKHNYGAGITGRDTQLEEVLPSTPGTVPPRRPPQSRRVR
jgi:cysteine synthase A